MPASDRQQTRWETIRTAAIVMLGVLGTLSLLYLVLLAFSHPPFSEPRKEETISNQDRLLAAIDAYRKVTGKFPPDPDPSIQSRPESNMAALLKHLGGQASKDADEGRRIAKATRGFLGRDPDSLTKDAWGRTMVYFRDRGLGGKPVIISAGADGEFGSDDKKRREDNIRSDTRH